MKNGVLFQGFEWNIPDDGNYFNDMVSKLEDLSRIGITSIWIPPVCKATGTGDNGYGVYDLYDLGEFDQKGSIRTKYGTKTELKRLISAIHEKNIAVYADVVLNHKAGADHTEKFMAVKVDSEDRTQEVEEPREIEAWTGFEFPGRGGKYSGFKWNFNHFTGVDYDVTTEDVGIFRILGENKGWNYGVSHENGNFDYLMFADIDHAHPDVSDELKSWADWFIKELDLDGFRLDAVKHIDKTFLDEFATHLKKQHGEDFYILGEYWIDNLDTNNNFLSETEYDIEIFDVSLHYKLYEASQKGNEFDLRTIFDDTLVKNNPLNCITFVDNHDSQPGESLYSFVEPWFKEIAYGLILLRKDGYPCIFYGDYYGIGGENPVEGFKGQIDTLALIRKNYSHGDQDDYFQESNLIGWVRHGDEEHPEKCVVVISTEEKKVLKMFLGKELEGRVFADFTGNCEDKITIAEDGFGDFVSEPGSISVWIQDGLPLEV